MKRIFTTLLVVSISIPAYSQNDPAVRYHTCVQCSDSGLDHINSSQTFTYDTARTYSAIQVADDYGPRQNGNNIYDWHGGIDYNSGPGNTDMGDLVLAILGGTIKGSLGQFYKYLVVEAGGGENFGYGHFLPKPVLQQRLALLHCRMGGILATDGLGRDRQVVFQCPPSRPDPGNIYWADQKKSRTFIASSSVAGHGM